MKKPSKNSLTILAAGAALWLIAIAITMLHRSEPNDLDLQIANTSSELGKLRTATADRATQAKSSIELINGSLWTAELITSWKNSLAKDWIAEPYGPAERKSVMLQTFTLELDQAPYDSGWPTINKTLREITELRNTSLRTVTIQGSPSPAQFFQRVFISVTFASKLP